MDLELDASISHFTNPNKHEHGASNGKCPDSSVMISKSLPPRKEALESLVKSKPHCIRLNSLRSMEKKSWKEISKSRRAVHRHKRDIYEIISLYAVLQGLLFMGVSQANNMKCSDSWGPIVLAIAIAIATMLATMDKVGALRKQKEEFQRHKDWLNAIFRPISDLRDRGAEVDLKTLRIEEEEEGYYRVESSFHVYRNLVLSFLVLFSVLIAFSSHHMLCAHV